MAQAGTQTSPESAKGNFSIGTGGPKEESRISPKLSRKERSGRSSVKRTVTPSLPQTPPTAQRPIQREVR